MYYIHVQKEMYRNEDKRGNKKKETKETGNSSTHISNLYIYIYIYKTACDNIICYNKSNKIIHNHLREPLLDQVQKEELIRRGYLPVDRCMVECRCL